MSPSRPSESLSAESPPSQTRPSQSLPSEARYLADACRALGFGFRDVSGDGYLLELSHHGRTIAVAAGRSCIYPTNSAAAVGISRDKLHTATLLQAHGMATFGGALFFVTDHHRQYRGAGREIPDALNYAREQGFPVFVKPNAGARGDLAEIVHDDRRLAAHLSEAAGRYDSVIIQHVFTGPEYRVLCVGGRAVVGVRRASGELIGDGGTLRELIAAYNAMLAGSGVSGLPAATADRIVLESGLSLDAVVPAGQRISLPGRRNLTAVGHAEYLIEQVPAGLAELAVRAADVVGLHIAGVDLMDTSERGDLSALRIIEVNGTPGLTALEQLGRPDLIRDVWRELLAVAFDTDLTLPSAPGASRSATWGSIP